VLYKIECDTHGKETCKEFNVRAYPTFLLTTPKLEPINRWMGYSKSMFQETMQLAMADLTTIDQKLARFEAKPSERDAATLARYDESRGQFESALQYYRKAAALNPDADYTAEIFETTVTGMRKDGGMTADDAKAAAAAVLASPKATAEDLFGVVFYSGPIVEQTGDRSFRVPYLKAAFERSEGTKDESLLKTREYLMPEYTLQVEKNAEKAVSLKKQAMPEGWRESPNQLNSFAWWCFENNVNLPEAHDLAAQGARLAPAGKERAMILDTQAEICHAMANCQDAVKIARQALAEDPDNEYYKDQLKRFEKALAEKS